MAPFPENLEADARPNRSAHRIAAGNVSRHIRLHNSRVSGHGFCPAPESSLVLNIDNIRLRTHIEITVIFKGRTANKGGADEEVYDSSSGPLLRRLHS